MNYSGEAMTAQDTKTVETPEQAAQRIVDVFIDERGVLELQARIIQAIRSAVAAERERCAQIADEIAGEPPTEPQGRHHDWQMGWQDGAMEAASAIRSLPTSGGEG